MSREAPSGRARPGHWPRDNHWRYRERGCSVIPSAIPTQAWGQQRRWPNPRRRSTMGPRGEPMKQSRSGCRSACAPRSTPIRATRGRQRAPVRGTRISGRMIRRRGVPRGLVTGRGPDRQRLARVPWLALYGSEGSFGSADCRSYGALAGSAMAPMTCLSRCDGALGVIIAIESVRPCRASTKKASGCQMGLVMMQGTCPWQYPPCAARAASTIRASTRQRKTSTSRRGSWLSSSTPWKPRHLEAAHVS